MNTGRTHFKEGSIPWNKGKSIRLRPLGYRHSEITKIKISENNGMRKRKGIIPKNLFSLLGENHWNWRGGVTSENKIIRGSARYRDWRKSVFERDGYTCVQCRQRGGCLQADHIQPFSLYPELRFEITNGRTLCLECHKKTDSYMTRSE